MAKTNPNFAWDEGLDYEKTYKQLVKLLKEAREQQGERALKRRLYLMALLTQLRNGSRVGEAVDFLVKVAEKFQREYYIPVEKRKDGKLRLMTLPEEITKADVLTIKGILLEEYNKNRKQLIINISKWTRKSLGFNTHSLRYAFITYLAKKSYPAQMIAKITGHARLDHIITYTQQKLAEDLLRKLPKL